MVNKNKTVALTEEDSFPSFKNLIKDSKRSLIASVWDCRMTDRAGSFDSGTFLEIAENDIKNE